MQQNSSRSSFAVRLLALFFSLSLFFFLPLVAEKEEEEEEKKERSLDGWKTSHCSLARCFDFASVPECWCIFRALLMQGRRSVRPGRASHELGA